MEQHQKVGDYILLEFLGGGQFGEVYKAYKQAEPGKYYAMKVIPKEKVQPGGKLHELFMEEVKIMTAIDHPNILHCYNF